MTLGSGLCGENVTKRSKILESKISRHGSRAEFMKKKSCLHKPLMIATFIYIMENWVEIMLPIIKQRFSLKIFLEAFLSAAELDAYRFEKKWSKKFGLFFFLLCLSCLEFLFCVLLGATACPIYTLSNNNTTRSKRRLRNAENDLIWIFNEA